MCGVVWCVCDLVVVFLFVGVCEYCVFVWCVRLVCVGFVCCVGVCCVCVSVCMCVWV